MKQGRILGLVIAVVIVAILVYAFYPADTGTETAPEAEETEAETEASYTDINPVQAKEMIDTNPDLIVIDVSPNYDEGHLPGAINYYVGGGELDGAIDSGALDPSAEYLVYCHFASASRLGAQKLVDAGFENVYRLEGEYGAWVDAGYTIEK